MGSAIYNTLEEIEILEPVFGDYENLFAPNFFEEKDEPAARLEIEYDYDDYECF